MTPESVKQKMVEDTGQDWPTSFVETLAPFTHSFFVQARYRYENRIRNQLICRVPELLGSLISTYKEQEQQ